jgi:hypothetical protein
MAEPATRPRLQWWPAALGVALAAFIAYDLTNGRDLANVLAAAGFVYLGAAALEKRTLAWPLFIFTFIIIGIVQAGFGAYNPTWVFVALAALFFIYGAIRGAWRQLEGLPLQTAIMAAIAILAAIAFGIDPALGAYLVAAGLLGHAALDVWLFLKNKVVVRSMTEFCFVLDTLLAIAIVVVTLRR